LRLRAAVAGATLNPLRPAGKAVNIAAGLVHAAGSAKFLKKFAQAEAGA
jgi:hypothetical protein